jgi:hypothetical protein
MLSLSNYKLQNNMKKNMLLIAAIALVGTGTFTVNNLLAQPSGNPPPAAGQPVAPPPGNPGPRQGPPPGFRSRPGMMNYRQAIVILKRAKTDLENSKEDFDGHRQSAMEACDKAAQELEAVQASIQAAAAAKAAAAKAAAAAAQPAPAPAQAPAATPAPNQ